MAEIKHYAAKINITASRAASTQFLKVIFPWGHHAALLALDVKMLTETKKLCKGQALDPLPRQDQEPYG